jgi:phage baseplate assembly protein W
MAVTISLPFSFNSSGAINTTASPQRQWADRVLGALFTMPGERVMNPSFGSLAKSSVFEPEGVVAEYITRTVSAAFGQYLSELTLLDVSVTKEDELGNEYLIVSVNYELPNREEESITTKIGTFSRTGELIQEIDNG